MKRIVLFCVVLIMVISVFAGCGESSETIVWGDLELGDALPETISNKGEVDINTNEDLMLSIDGISEEDYNNYLRQCKDSGYTIDADSGSTVYTAYNKEGYRLYLSHYKSSKSLTISLETPMKFVNIEWPMSDIAKAIPVPKSKTGLIKWENSDGFVLYVSNTSTEEYSEYIKSCKSAGFTLDYTSGDEYYRASHKKGFELSVEYKGNNTILIRADVIKEPIVTPNPSPSVLPSSSPSISVDGLSKEFKEAMDSYEAFFDSYIAFMEKYNNSTDQMSMMDDFANYMTKYSDTMSKMTALNTGNLSAKELLYYSEVISRINTKLLAVIK